MASQAYARRRATARPSPNIRRYTGRLARRWWPHVATAAVVGLALIALPGLSAIQAVFVACLGGFFLMTCLIIGGKWPLEDAPEDTWTVRTGSNDPHDTYHV